MNSKPSWDTTPDLFSDQNSTTVSDYFEHDAITIMPNSETAKAMQQIYGVLPKEFRKALRNLENYPDVKGLPVAPLTALNGSFGGLRFINLNQGNDIIIGHGGIMFNESQLKKATVLLTEDSQTAFKLSESKYPVFLLNRISKDQAAELKQTFTDCCVVTTCDHVGDLKRRLSGLGIKVIGLSEPATQFTDAVELENEVNDLLISTHSINWKDPKQIKAELLPVKPLNKEMLPLDLAEYVYDEANRADNMPPDFVAVCTLVSMCSVIGARVGIKPKRLDDWTVIPNLWGGIVAPPSAKKSPAFNAGTYPLDRLVKEAREEHVEALKQYEVSSLVRDSNEKALKDKLKEASKKTDVEKQKQIASQLLELQESDSGAPILKRYKTNDASPEALAELEKRNPNGILVCRDELVGLLSSLDRNDSDSGRAFYLEGWNGNKPYEFDRIMRGAGFIENHCLSILGGIQPDKLITYLEPSIKGLGNDGLLQRFQLLVFPDVNNWDYRDEFPNKDARNTAFELFSALDKLTPNELVRIGAHPADEYNPRPYFRFSDEAQECFIQWTKHLHGEIIANEEHTIIGQHLDKYGKLMPALALVFHLIDGIQIGSVGPVSKRSAEMAIEWCEYLESHARRIYGLVLQSATMKAGMLCQKLKNFKDGDDWRIKGFTLRDVQRKSWKSLTSNESVNDALDILIDSEWLVLEEIESTIRGGRPSKRYWINPKIYEIL